MSERPRPPNSFVFPPAVLSFFNFHSLFIPPNQGSSFMNSRIMLAVAAVLAIGACNDQQGPNTPGSNQPEMASTTGTIGINVVLKAPATAANRPELAKYGPLLDEIAELKAIRVRPKESQLSAIRALPFVKAATPD